MRESYRLSKHPVILKYRESGKSLDVVFMYIGTHSKTLEKASFENVSAAMKRLMTTLASGSGE